MPNVDLEMGLSSEAKAARDMARKFGMEVMRPAGIELDKQDDPADVIAKGSVLWDVFKTYRELGLHKRGMPKEYGGMVDDEMDPMSGILISEQLGYADAGLAISLGVSSFPFVIAAMSPEPEIKEMVKAYCDDMKGDIIGCWAITEPDHGSDWIMAALPASRDPRMAPSFRAELKGDEYILNGRKSAWVSNGTMATHASLHVCLDPSKGMQGSGLCIIPLDLPGVSRGKPLNKIGQRPLNQGEIIFEDVKIPKKWMMIANPELMTGIVKMGLGMANGGMSLIFIGLAQAAFDEAFNYAKERVQGGVPIIEHQNIKLKLFNMYKKVESARAFLRKVALYNRAKGPAGSPMHGMMAKILTTDTAFEVASEAITIFGGNGLAKEYPIEKMFRDARASMIEDGVNESLALAASADL